MNYIVKENLWSQKINFDVQRKSDLKSSYDIKNQAHIKAQRFHKSRNQPMVSFHHNSQIKKTMIRSKKHTDRFFVCFYLFGLLPIFLFLVSVILLTPCRVYGEERGGSILIDYSVENHSKGIKGAEFALVKVMDYENGTYYPRKVMRICNVKEEALWKYPQETAKYLTKQLDGKTELQKITKVDGTAEFLNLTDGLWLLTQISRKDTAVKYEYAVPAFIQIPSWVQNTKITRVVVLPKTTRRNLGINDESYKETDKEKETVNDKNSEWSKNDSDQELDHSETSKNSGNSKNVQSGKIRTGDENPLCWYSFSIFLGLMVLCTLHKRRENRINTGRRC